MVILSTDNLSMIGGEKGDPKAIDIFDAVHSSTTYGIISNTTTNGAILLDAHYDTLDAGMMVGGMDEKAQIVAERNVAKIIEFDETHRKSSNINNDDDRNREYFDSIKKYDQEADEDAEVPESERTNYAQTLMNLLNGIIGSCVLSMPLAFKDAGWLVALIVTPIIGLISTACIHLLLAVNVHLVARTPGRRAPYDYHDLAECAFANGPRSLRRYSRAARLVVIGTIVGTQVGACCVYYVFIATNIEKFLAHRMGASAPPNSTCLLLILPVVIAINWIRNIRYLSYLSTVSNVLQVAGISVVLYALLSRPIERLDRLPPIGDKIPQYFVTTLFIFEGSSVSMSLYKAIRKPRHFRMKLGVLNVGEALVMAFYTTVGFLGYLQFGELTEGTITSSLPAEPMYDAVQLSYAIVVLGTYPVLMYVPIQVLWTELRRKIGPALAPHNRARDPADMADNNAANNRDDRRPAGGAKLLIAELAFRASLVLITYILAVVVPQLDLIIALVGAVSSSLIAVMIPAILHLVTFWNERKDTGSKVRLIVTNLVLFTIGFIAFTLGIYFSLSDIIDSYRETDAINCTTANLATTTTTNIANLTTSKLETKLF